MKTIRPAPLIAVLLPISCHQSDEPEPSRAAGPPIDTPALAVESVVQTVYEQVVGSVQPQLQATIAAKTTGHIIEMLAVPGKSVEKDQLLARIETPQLEAAMARADAALANARSEAERYRSLRDSGSVSQREIERVETALQVATAEHNQIKSRLDEAVIKAPFAGRITHKQRDIGDLVQPGTPICRIEDPSRLRFDMHVAETLANKITLGQTFRVVIASGELDIEGAVAEISPAADVGSRTFLIKLDLPAEKSLLAGQFGRAFLPRTTRSSIMVPQTAILQRGQLSYAAVVDDENVARLRIVRTGATGGSGVEILAGLEQGERILTEIPANFAGGTRIKTDS